MTNSKKLVTNSSKPSSRCPNNDSIPILESIAEPAVHTDIPPSSSSVQNDQQWLAQYLVPFVTGKYVDKEPISVLIKALHTSNDWVTRYLAIIALELIGTARIVHEIIKTLQNDKNSNVRKAAASSLSKFGSKKAIDALIRTLQNDSSAIVRHEAALALGVIGTDQAITALRKALKQDRSARVRAQAFSALSANCEEDFKEVFIEVLENDLSTKVRRFAIKVIRETSMIEAAPALIRVLDQDKSLRVRLGAIKSLQNISRQLGYETLSQFLKNYRHLSGEKHEPTPFHQNTLEVEPIRILFLAANPKQTDRLAQNDELKKIQTQLSSTMVGEKFDISAEWSVTKETLPDIIADYNPHVIHFTGHGIDSGELIFEDQNGFKDEATVDEIAQLFGVIKHQVKDLHCVVISACHSEQVAEEIADYVDYVVAMADAIRDTAAADFSAEFYRQIVQGKSIKFAFNLACEVLKPYEQSIPDLFSQTNIKLDFRVNDSLLSSSTVPPE